MKTKSSSSPAEAGRGDVRAELDSLRRRCAEIEQLAAGLVSAEGSGGFPATARDISVRREAEQSLRESEKKYRSLVDQLNDVLCITDAAGNLTYVSPAIARYGFQPDSVIGHHMTEYILPEDQDRVTADFRRTMETGEEFPTEFRVRNDKGQLFWFEDIGRVLRDDKGNIIGLQALLRDITSRRSAEQALQESEKRFRALIQNSWDVIAVVAPDGTVRFLSEAVTNILDSKPEKLVGIPWSALVHPDDMPVAQAGWERTLREPGRRERSEVRVWRKDGSWRWVETITQNLSHVPGVDGVVVNIRDITERKQADEQFAMFRRFAEASSQGFGMATLDGRITYVNSALCRQNDAERPEDMIGTSFRQHFGEEARRRMEEEVMPAVMRDGHWTGEMASVSRKGRSVSTLESHFLIRDDAGKPIALAAVITDRTEHKQAEEALRQSEEQYRALVETTQTGYVIIDTEGKVLDANPEYVRLTGHKRLEEIQGRSVFEWTADYEKEKNTKAVEKCAKDGHIRNLEIDYVDRRGNITPIEINATVVETGGAPRILTLCRDITQRRRDQEALQKSQDAYKNIVENINDALFIHDVKGKIEEVNEQACRMLGYAPEELTGKSIRMLAARDRRENVQTHFREILDRGSLSFEGKMVTKSGGALWVNVSSKLLRRDGRQMIQSLVRDMTEKKRLEDQLTRIAGFEREKIRSDLHDSICQQLSGAALMAENLHRSLKTGSPADAELAAEIRKVATDTVYLAREIARSLVPTLRDSSELLSALDDLAARIGTVYKIRCRVKASAAVPIGDPDVLTQLFLIAQEATINAARHSKAKTIVIALSGGRNQRKLTVRDNGIGIRKKGLTGGLGLDIMRSRADLIGWTLDIRPGEKAGTIVECVSKGGQ